MPERDPSLHILQHALGMDDYGQLPKGEYRNHYCTESDSADWAMCMAHVEAGRMTRHGPSQLYGGNTSYCFVVTDAGRAFVREHSPKPPKVSRAKQRYLEWLAASDAWPDLTFADYLKGARPWEKRP